MHADLPPEMQDRFYAEVETLRELDSLQEQVGVAYIPKLLRVDRRADPPVIVMQHITGTSVESQLSASSRPIEQQALHIAEQLSHLLHILHASGITYPGMQFGNLYWDPGLQQLQVIGWERIDRDVVFGVERDLQQFSNYFYRMLTGDNAPAESEQLLDIIRMRPSWDALSWGVRQLLTRAFHQTPAQRYHTADDFRLDIRQHRALFGEPPRGAVSARPAVFRHRQSQRSLPRARRGESSRHWRRSLLWAFDGGAAGRGRATQTAAVAIP